MNHMTITDAAPDRDDMAKRLDFIQGRLISNNEMIQLADRKAQTLLRLVLGLFMIAFVGVPPTVMSLQKFYGAGGWKLALFVGTVFLYLVCAGCLLLSMIRIISIIRPRLPRGRNLPRSLFFASVANMSKEEFRQYVLEADTNILLEDLVDQTYQTALIAKTKYQHLNAAIGWMLGGGVVGIVFAEILLVTTGLAAGG